VSPVIIHHVDLSAAEPVIPLNPALRVCIVFWWRKLPLGMRLYLSEELPLRRSQWIVLTAELAAGQLAARLPEWGAPFGAVYDGRPRMVVSKDALLGLGNPLHLLEKLAQPAVELNQDITVIVCTRDRATDLDRCLHSLIAQRVPPAEIIVVDNSPQASASLVCAGFPGVVYIHEPQPGLSRARNTGIAAARSALIAFTDDDVEVHPGWTAELSRAFRNNKVDVVTGLVLPARLDTEAQEAFQFDLGGLGNRFVPALFDTSFFTRYAAFAVPTWRIGAGANMAFRRSVFSRVGPFDQRLGAGAAGCSEDSELWYRVLLAGGQCLYEPRAVVFHNHRADWSELTKQMRAYMEGHVAALIVQGAYAPRSGNHRRIWCQIPMNFLRAVKNGSRSRRAILPYEISGWFRGLRYFWRKEWRTPRSCTLNSILDVEK